MLEYFSLISELYLGPTAINTRRSDLVREAFGNNSYVKSDGTLMRKRLLRYPEEIGKLVDSDNTHEVMVIPKYLDSALSYKKIREKKLNQIVLVETQMQKPPSF